MTTTPRQETPHHLSHADLLRLKRWNTPTVYNGWEQITSRDASHEGYNKEETRDFMPQMGPMVGYAVTLQVELSNEAHSKNHRSAWLDYYRYVAGQPGPKIVVMQDLDKPAVYGSFWGEVTANFHRTLGCVGGIIDGAIRDVDEMTNAGFKALARRLAVGHAHACPLKWNVEVDVFGQRIAPGQLIHADKHGFVVIPKEDEARLPEAVAFMDANECETIIPSARDASGLTHEEILKRYGTAAQKFRAAALEKFGSGGEW